MILYCWPETNCTINCNDNSSCLNADMKCHYNNCFTQGINGDQVIIEEGWTHYPGPTPEPTNNPTIITDIPSKLTNNPSEKPTNNPTKSTNEPTMTPNPDKAKQNDKLLPILLIIIGCLVILIICASILLMIIKSKKKRKNVEYMDNQNIKNRQNYKINKKHKKYDNFDNSILHTDSMEGNQEIIKQNTDDSELLYHVNTTVDTTTTGESQRQSQISNNTEYLMDGPHISKQSNITRDGELPVKDEPELESQKSSDVENLYNNVNHLTTSDNKTTNGNLGNV